MVFLWMGKIAVVIFIENLLDQLEERSNQRRSEAASMLGRWRKQKRSLI